MMFHLYSKKISRYFLTEQFFTKLPNRENDNAGGL